IFRDARREPDDEKRRKLYRRFQDIAAEEVPLIFTAQRAPIIAVRSRVQNVEPAAVGVLHNIARILVSQ
ncbi:MAG: ABC transporter substrate-binding protein, partial [Planctomycetota bacterium]|nr:ABC transporter substrate-binding protein [Planctomycetota bacterium]